MRLLLFSSLLLVTTALAAQSADDLLAIRTTLTNYLDGATNNDYDQLASAFHPDARMQGITEDGLMNVNAREFFREIMQPGPPVNRVTRISGIDITGNLASARLEMDYPTFRFVDMMTLLKVDGDWLIVSKAYYREPREVESLK